VSSSPSTALARRTGEDLLTVTDLHVSYGNIAAVKGVTPVGQAGRDRHPDRLERRRQVDHAADHLRAAAAEDRQHRLRGQLAGRDARPQIVGAGICQSPEGRRIFPRMSVDENLDLGAFLRNDKAAIAADKERVLDLFPRLKERISQQAGTMSGGEQQMLAVGRALMGSPRLLLLGRALDGPGPGAGRPDLRHHPDDPRPGHHRPGGGAERAGRRCGSGTTPTCWNPAG